MRYIKKQAEVHAWDVASLLLHYDSHGMGALPLPVSEAWEDGLLEFTPDHIIVITVKECQVARGGDMLVSGANGWSTCRMSTFFETHEQAI